MNVPFVDLKAQFQSIKHEVEPAVHQVMESAGFIGGPVLQQFEAQFAAYCEAEFALGVGNGTDAIELALAALGVGPGDEVITQANSFIATAAPIARVGAKPVFVDMDPETFTIDPQQIEAAITPRTKVIIPVHLYGQPADMAPIMEIARRRGLYVIEDAAQAHGATYNGQRVGSFGDIACFSFYPGKNLGAYGDGGAVVSNDASIMDRVLLLRDHGSKKKYEHIMVGRNSRLDSMQAAILKIKLDRLDGWNEQRRQAAEWYGAALANVDVKLPQVRPGSTHVFHLYVIETDDREKLQSELGKAGIGTGIHYPVPLHQQPALASLVDPGQRFPCTEASAPRILSLPMFPEITREQVEYVAQELGRIKAELAQPVTV